MTVHKSHLVIRLNYPKNQLINELSQQTVTECQLWARHWTRNEKPSIIQSAKCNFNQIIYFCNFILHITL